MHYCKCRMDYMGCVRVCMSSPWLARSSFSGVESVMTKERPTATTNNGRKAIEKNKRRWKEKSCDDAGAVQGQERTVFKVYERHKRTEDMKKKCILVKASGAYSSTILLATLDRVRYQCSSIRGKQFLSYVTRLPGKKTLLLLHPSPLSSFLPIHPSIHSSIVPFSLISFCFPFA